MKIKYYFFIISCMFLTLSCERENLEVFDDSSLVGKWTKTIDARPQGLLLYELTLKNDATFLFRIDHFGVYAGENDQDLSAWTEFSGSLEQTDPNFLILKTQRYAWWDSFYDMTPITEDSTAKIFENCTYEITNDVLKLTYTTYPADAPIETTMELIRVQ